MTSKSLFFNLIKEDAKRRLWALALGFLAFFFLLPVRVAMFFTPYDVLEGKNYTWLVSRLKDWIGFRNGGAAVFFIVLSLILGVTGFSYLHSRQRVDFYHGLPIKRETLFWANYCNGIFFTIVLYGVNLILAIAVASVNGIHAGELVSTALSSYLFFMLHFCLLYSVTVLSMVLTGNVVVGILGTGVLHFILPCALLVGEICFSEFFHTSYQSGAMVLYNLLYKCSAFVLFLDNMWNLDGEVSAAIWAARILGALLAAVVLTLLSLFLYKKRGSEAAGRAMAFPVTQPVIRIPIVALSSLFGSLFFWSMRSSMGWAVFGLFCGMFLSHCTIEIIYHFDFRQLFSHWKQMLVCAGAAALVFVCFRYDLFGYDQYVPKKSSIEWAAVSIDDLNWWISYGKPVQDSSGEYSWQYESGDEYLLSHMKLTSPEVVLSLAEKSAERSRSLYHGADVKEEERSGKRYHTISVCYQLKNKRKVYRTYNLPAEEISTEIAELYKNQDFLTALYPVLTQTPEETAWVRIKRNEQTSTVSRDSNGTDKAMTEKLLSAYQKDLLALNKETMEKENPVAAIQFMTRMQAQAEKEKERFYTSWKYEEVISNGFYPVYPSFHNTLELLRECQVDVDEWLDLSGIKKVVFEMDQFQESNYDERSLTITDAAEIEQLMKSADVAEYTDMNPFYDSSKKKAEFSAFTDAGGGWQEIYYIIEIEKLPASVKSQIEQMKDEA